MKKFIVTQAIIDSLYDAGILSQADSDVRRVVIDLKVGEAAVMYLERFINDEQFDIVRAGIKIVDRREAAGVARGRSQP